MKDFHKAIGAVIVIVVALYVFHLMSAHQGMSLTGGLGTK
jgi:hypothetical protein